MMIVNESVLHGLDQGRHDHEIGIPVNDIGDVALLHLYVRGKAVVCGVGYRHLILLRRSFASKHPPSSKQYHRHSFRKVYPAV